MGRLAFRTAAFAIVASLTMATPAGAQEAAGPLVPAPPAIAAPEPAVVLAKMSADPRTPEGYSAKVELHVKLRTFPFIGLTVHGTSDFRKPGFYHYQLQNLPHIAAKFDDLRYDLGDPLTWGARYTIAIAPGSTEEAPVLRLTPKKTVMVTYLDIQTDPKFERMLKVTWKRKDGGTIAMTQTYATVGPSDVVTAQHATIDIPHMRAEVTATYSDIVVETPMVAGAPER